MICTNMFCNINSTVLDWTRLDFYFYIVLYLIIIPLITEAAEPPSSEILNAVISSITVPSYLNHSMH